MRRISVWFLPILIVAHLVAADPGPEQQAREFVTLLDAGDFAAAVARFDETMSAAMPEASLKTTWEQVVTQAGAFVEQLGVRKEKYQAYDIVLVTCRFERADLDVKVVLDPSSRIAGLFFAPAAPSESAIAPEPAYADPSRFAESEVVVGEGEWALPGTLAVPEGDGPFPAVVLVHGSGPNDRDETIGPNKPFRDIAWGLASNGIAVLRYDKRTLTHGAKLADDIHELTVQEESIDDCLAAVRLLRGREELRADAVFVVGHSLGAMLVPRIAMQDDTIRGFVVLAGPARPLHELIPAQVDYIARLDGEVSEAEKQGIEEARKGVEKINALTEEQGGSDQESVLGVGARYWLDLREYRPHEEAKKVNRPILVLHAKRDYQVTMEDFALWKSALGTRADVELVVYPELNHLFIAGEGPGSPAEYQLPGNVSEELVGDIADWIRKQAGGLAGS